MIKLSILADVSRWARFFFFRIISFSLWTLFSICVFSSNLSFIFLLFRISFFTFVIFVSFSFIHSFWSFLTFILFHMLLFRISLTTYLFRVSFFTAVFSFVCIFFFFSIIHIFRTSSSTIFWYDFHRLCISPQLAHFQMLFKNTSPTLHLPRRHQHAHQTLFYAHRRDIDIS